MHFQGLVIWNQQLMEVTAGTPKISKETLYCANQNGNTGSLTSYNQPLSNCLKLQWNLQKWTHTPQQTHEPE